MIFIDFHTPSYYHLNTIILVQSRYFPLSFLLSSLDSVIFKIIIYSDFFSRSIFPSYSLFSSSILFFMSFEQDLEKRTRLEIEIAGLKQDTVLLKAKVIIVLYMFPTVFFMIIHLFSMIFVWLFILISLHSLFLLMRVRYAEEVYTFCLSIILFFKEVDLSLPSPILPHHSPHPSLPPFPPSLPSFFTSLSSPPLLLLI